MNYNFTPYFLVFIIFSILPFRSVAQNTPDTTQYIDPVKVNAYFSEQDVLRVTTSAAVVDRTLLNQQQGTTLLPAVNTIPGVRMEERSPGSYRLSIRGSLLRSPFGVRNVKVYLDEIPLTDAGGNTYLNLIDAGSLTGMEVLKGPDGSLFGANSGGVVILTPQGMESGGTNAHLRLSGGSYGLFHQQAGGTFEPSEKYRFSINQAHQQAEGYRENAAMRRDYFQTVQRWTYNERSELRFIGLYSDMQYRTPGGLTQAQFAENPAASRPATPAIPGSREQQAGIYNKTFVGGLIHDFRITDKLRHVVSVYGLTTDFRNPFITNYELRDEHNYGFRTYLGYSDAIGRDFRWGTNAGVEWQRGQADIFNYDNNGGERGDPQASDILDNKQHFYFMRLTGDWKDRLFIEASISLNQYGYGFRSVYPVADPNRSTRDFEAAWMPRVGFSYLLSNALSWRATVSKGYSPPTTAEIRSSDNIINTDLDAETGWNYETGIRFQSNDNRFFIDGSVFHYRMENAIVRRLNDSGAEFFANAGAVTQRGLELAVTAWLVQPRPTGWLNGVQLGSNLTLSKFRFTDYQSAGTDFSGNRLTGVPSETVVSHIRFLLPHAITAYIMHNYTSSIPLNDGNTVYADAYHLLQAKVSYSVPILRRWNLQAFVGSDNILNQTYSLGNDINAFGGRFFNTAAPRNYYGGLSLTY